MKLFCLVLMSSILFGCAPMGSFVVPMKGDTGASVVGPKGDTGDKGDSGKDGAQGPAGDVGPRGADGEIATVVQLCPGSSNYGVFIEVALCINGVLYGVYSDHGGFMTYLAPGNYYSNGIGSACNFKVVTSCTIEAL